MAGTVWPLIWTVAKTTPVVAATARSRASSGPAHLTGTLPQPWTA